MSEIKPPIKDNINAVMDFFLPAIIVVIVLITGIVYAMPDESIGMLCFAWLIGTFSFILTWVLMAWFTWYRTEHKTKENNNE